MSCLVIAEAGVNHNGREDLALQLVDAAADSGANVVKFQTFTADTLVTKGTAKATYQEKNTGQGDQYSMLKQLELPYDTYVRLRDRAADRGIEFLSTPFDEAAADMLAGLGIRRMKVPSGELTNLPFLRHLAGFNLPMIVSTGMSTLAEIVDALEAIVTTRRSRGFDGRLEQYVTILHCTSNYPAEWDQVNLRAMRTMRDRFGLPVGYSDHTMGALASVAAVAAGAVVIEKHFTLDASLPGPDHRASLEPAMFADMVRQIRTVEVLLGSAEKMPCSAELPIRDLVRKSVTTKRTVAAGQRFTKDDLALLRPGTGIPPKDLDLVRGQRAARDLPAGTTLQWGDLRK
jgi:N,N'-diacetyllegionaminate synthase